MSTIAHELGHAYHNLVLSEAPEIFRDYPMTLAETASIFCQTLVVEDALKNCTESEELELLEEELSDSTQVIVDILSRFIFEKEVFSRREKGELPASEFCAIMEDAQQRTYGDALDPEKLHPYMWAVKGHYYRPELGFYNFPYAFGKLFGLGLFSRYRSEGEAFTAVYRDLLYMTGSADAEAVTMKSRLRYQEKGFLAKRDSYDC